MSSGCIVCVQTMISDDESVVFLSEYCVVVTN